VRLQCTDLAFNLAGLNFGKKFHVVANCALRLVASMKRDWMQTGRRPSGICGAALFIAAHVHGFERSKADVVGVVHVCEATLKKRLVEFESTESGSLTVGFYTISFNPEATSIG
jgi:transcription factor IIIB subunit 2